MPHEHGASRPQLGERRSGRAETELGRGHCRVVDAAERPRVAGTVECVLAAYPDALKVTLGEMVYEVEPKLDWDKG